MYDVAIIGGGILGCTIARELSRYHLHVTVLEKAYDIGEGATKTNSGVLAAGFHPRGGSLKGISCVKGNDMYRQICEELDIPVRFIGSLYVAFSRNGTEMIAQKYNKGIKNGVQRMEIIDGDQARSMQPGLSPKVIQALYAPTTGIIDVFGLILRTAQNASENGVEFHFDTEVSDIIDEGRHYTVHTNKGTVQAEYIVNTAGEEAASIEGFLRPADLVIRPRRGQFYVFDKQTDSVVRHVIYQAQDMDEKGCLLTLSIDGNLIAGPTSENVSSYKRVETTREGLELIEQVARKIMPGLDMGKVIASFAGARTNISNVAKEEKDFVIRKSARNMVSALGIKNPGLTGAPYLALKAVDILREEGLILEAKAGFNTQAVSGKKFLDCSVAEQKKRMTEDRRYGNVICRCEKITEGDILRVLSEPLPPRTLNGMKKRLRAGMGRCQGSFCTPRIIEILSREMKVKPEKILKNTQGSSLVKGRVK
ncbi:NAD(P)/FAD-dependent oxidoreductase [Parasporobacterium paucivorans]|uniref:Glycerol-3-phosphate dehydrogenase n=1 Tax=Parasporobacterium paucivorans DSM 15970 TaxID=1122934 RepID=A0A1M6K6K2_9FIRM|nr:NAD(P)/FAD-dependent oxidoreductase [Parasporobacterium paucivorans]SHJ54565.1 glycerol-3-phosphate dehydrogenase [Parasporobacterium paucivorans DSM 15970]